MRVYIIVVIDKIDDIQVFDDILRFDDEVVDIQIIDIFDEIDDEVETHIIYDDVE